METPNIPKPEPRPEYHQTELERIGELTGISPDELAGMEPFASSETIEQDFDSDQVTLEPNSESDTRHEPASVNPAEQTYQGSRPIVQEALVATQALAKIRTMDFAGAVRDITRLTAMGLAMPVLEELYSAIKADKAMEQIINQKDYTSSFELLRTTAQAAQDPAIQQALRNVINQGQRRTILTGWKVDAITMPEVEVYSYLIDTDQVREDLILDIIESEPRDYNLAERLCLKHIGKYYSVTSLRRIIKDANPTLIMVFRNREDLKA